MTALKPKNNKAGFSLTSLMMGLVLAAGGAFVAATIMQEGTLAGQRAETIGLLQQQHMLSTALLRQQQNIRASLRLDSEDNEVLRACLVGEIGTQGCTALAEAGWQTLDFPAELGFGNIRLNGHFGTSLGPCNRSESNAATCTIEKSSEYRLICPNDSHCSQVELRLTDAYVGNSRKLRAIPPMETLLQFSAHSFVSVQSIDYGCAQRENSVITRFSADGKRAYCSSLSEEANCQLGSSQELLRGYAENLCSSVVSNTCVPDDGSPRDNLGYQRVGAIESEALCQDSLSAGGSVDGRYRLIRLSLFENYRRQSQSAGYISTAATLVFLPAGNIPAEGITVDINNLDRQPGSSDAHFPLLCKERLDGLSLIDAVRVRLQADGAVQLLRSFPSEEASSSLFMNDPPNPGQNTMVNFQINPAFCD